MAKSLYITTKNKIISGARKGSGVGNMEQKDKILVRVIKMKHINAVFHFNNDGKKTKIKYRMANKIWYLKKLVEYIIKNGTEHDKLITSKQNEKYLMKIYDIYLTKKEILELLGRPRRKAKKYEELLKLLKS